MLAIESLGLFSDSNNYLAYQLIRHVFRCTFNLRNSSSTKEVQSISVQCVVNDKWPQNPDFTSCESYQVMISSYSTIELAPQILTTENLTGLLEGHKSHTT